jgi:hypothetical protein
VEEARRSVLYHAASGSSLEEFLSQVWKCPVDDSEFEKRKEIQSPQERLVEFSSFPPDKQQTLSMLSSSLIPLIPVILTEVRATLSEVEGV